MATATEVTQAINALRCMEVRSLARAIGLTITDGGKPKPTDALRALIAGWAESAPIDPDTGQDGWEKVHEEIASIKGKSAANAVADAPKGAGALIDQLKILIEEVAAQTGRDVPAPVDPDEILAIVKAEIDKALAEFKPTSTTMHIVRPDVPDPIDVGRVHPKWDELMITAIARKPNPSDPSKPKCINIWLGGPTGSGKTYAAKQLATALGLPFYFTGAIDSEYKLKGFVDATGRVADTQFRQAIREPSVFCFDEIDRSLPRAVLAFNAALSNDLIDLPGETEPVERDPMNLIVATANTWGLGGTADYVGALKHDAALLARFAKINWPYDDALEMDICPDKTWAGKVQAYRRAMFSQGIKAIISPRASYDGAAIIESAIAFGKSRRDAERIARDLTMKNGISDEDWNRIENASGVTI